MISVVIRTKNQKKQLDFLLKNLTTRYANDIAEIIVIDNQSTDNSQKLATKYGVRWETITQFSYGGSANFATEKAKYDYVVIFSAHSYPVSPDFFKVIHQKFDANPNLAGTRCLHTTNDYKNYINNISAKEDPNKSGLIFSGSAFSKKVWKQIPFNENVPTFEDKDWTKRVLKAGFDIEFAPVVFNYEIKRTKAQEFFRFKNDTLGNYQIWHQEVKLKSVFAGLFFSLLNNCKTFFSSNWYSFKRFFFQLSFKYKKIKKFNY